MTVFVTCGDAVARGEVVACAVRVLCDVPVTWAVPVARGPAFEGESAPPSAADAWVATTTMEQTSENASPAMTAVSLG